MDFKVPSGNGWDSNLTVEALQVCVGQVHDLLQMILDIWKICCFHFGNYTKAEWDRMNSIEVTCVSSTINSLGDKHKLQSGVQDETTNTPDHTYRNRR